MDERVLIVGMALVTVWPPTSQLSHELVRIPQAW